MKKFRLISSIVLFLALSSAGHAASAEALDTQLREVVEASLVAFNNENAQSVLDQIHTKSPAFSQMEATLGDQFAAIDSETMLEQFTYIGHDDEFAVARVKYRTVGKSDKPFMDNVLDTITTFHQENGAWKYWSHDVLGVRLVDK